MLSRAGDLGLEFIVRPEPPTPKAFIVRVLPGFLETRARLLWGRPKRAFKREDFPPLGRRRRVTSGNGEGGRVRK